MTDTPVSVIVVSRHRTELLLQCLAALRLQDHPLMEVIVVADPAAAQDVAKLGLPLKLAVFDEANIAAARNVGLAMAAGDVVAFIDDDGARWPVRWEAQGLPGLPWQMGLMLLAALVMVRWGVAVRSNRLPEATPVRLTPKSKERKDWNEAGTVDARESLTRGPPRKTTSTTANRAMPSRARTVPRWACQK